MRVDEKEKVTEETKTENKKSGRGLRKKGVG
jgi:hypothetical protein